MRGLTGLHLLTSRKNNLPLLRRYWPRFAKKYWLSVALRTLTAMAGRCNNFLPMRYTTVFPGIIIPHGAQRHLRQQYCHFLEKKINPGLKAAEMNRTYKCATQRCSIDVPPAGPIKFFA